MRGKDKILSFLWLTQPISPLQELIVLRAIRDANVPKFLMDDLKLFNGIVSDLFPKIQDVPVDYGEMEQSIRNRATERGLEDVQGMM
jgi:dynein heavy chain